MKHATPVRTLAALAGACLLAAATPAAAAKFVFDVTLYLKTVSTTTTGDELSSVNITFQQTYEGPLSVQSYFVTSYGPPEFSDYFGNAYASVQYAPIAISEAPVQDEVRAVADGFVLTGGGGLGVAGTSTLSDGVYTAKISYDANESHGYYRSDYDTYTEVQPVYRTTRAGWSQGFGVPGSGDEFVLPQHLGALTGQDFLDGLAGLELSYAIIGYSSDELDIFTYDPETGANVYSHEYLVNNRIIYDGYARLNLELSDLSDAVPEPSAWALMLLGFGAVGSAIRRRRFAL